jgi:antitoxin HigA-1
MTELLDEIHPGEILLEDFMKPMGITARQLAADNALRLGLFFNMEPRFWLNLQTEYDMRMTTRDQLETIAPRIRVFRAYVDGQ